MFVVSITHQAQSYSKLFLPFKEVCLQFCNVYSKLRKLQLSPAVIKLTTDTPAIILSVHNRRESDHA